MKDKRMFQFLSLLEREFEDDGRLMTASFIADVTDYIEWLEATVSTLTQYQNNALNEARDNAGAILKSLLEDKQGE